jgi:RecA-family ATPase
VRCRTPGKKPCYRCLSLFEEEHQPQRQVSAPVDLSEFDDPPPVVDVWQGLITSGLISTLYGDSGQGKSTLVDGLATCISLGQPFLGHPVMKGPVVILDWELRQDITLHRLYRIARGFGLAKPPPIMYQSLFDPLTHYLDDILAWCEQVNPVLLMVDSMGPAYGGDPMNPKLAIDLMNALRQLPASPLVVDHQGNPTQGQDYSNKREFGTSWKRHLTRSSLQVEMADNQPRRASVVLRQHKDNFGPKSDPLAFHVRYEGDAIRFEVADVNDMEFHEVKTLSADRKVEKALNETASYLTKAEIMEITGIDKEKNS